ncbi:endonuclease/exonuclease/phosphatase family protein [Actomonas aquatica]|uniref:Endonuclease/exonuclease/phosphatase family protein n=1 Tax=Actomonas aquatica TaxID=2866162 RepID=A0ABZ1C5A7_9BACT|nr:endonuclease/exonuclease/phosphatase family protein [Opitutus sp. WL0086]WRQ86845.1 endonuclease/exonuclease/phosphatase family protein [Opitutus sp. WL0086]
MSGFRFLQFNIQFGQVWDASDPDNAPIDLDQTIAEIRRHDADIITLQEVEQARSDGQQADPPPNFQRLRAALPEYHAHFSYPKADPRELPFGIGLAIFSKTPLHERMRQDLPSPRVEFDFFGETKTPTDRVLIGAKTTIAGHEVTIYNVHLLAFFMLKTSSETHGGQRRQVAELLRQSDGPTLLAGDFNVSRPGPLIDQYEAVGFQTVQDETITWHRMPFVLDHIFYNESLRCVEHEIVRTEVSDHLPLRADFEFVD